MVQGTIVRKNPKGFGFISKGEGTQDIFFHASEVVGILFNDLNEGDKVTFEEVVGKEGRLAAVNVKLVA